MSQTEDFILTTYYPCIRNLARPGLVRAKAWLESQGESGHKPGYGRVGQGIKNPGKPHHRARPWLTGEKISTAWHEEKEKPWPAWLGMAGAGQGQTVVKLAKEPRPAWPGSN